MQRPETWVAKLTGDQREWVREYMQKRLQLLPWSPTYPYPQDSKDPGIERLTEMVTTLQNDTERGSEKFRAMDNALRKKVWRGRSDGVERTVILGKDLDKNLTRLMRSENLDRSTVVNRCVENAVFSRKQEWDKLEAKRLRLQKREERLQARENRLIEREEANRESRMAEEERESANNVPDFLVRALSKALDDSAVEFQFDADVLIFLIDFREGNSRTRVWSEEAKKELEKALKRYMSGEACSTQEDGARDQSQR